MKHRPAAALVSALCCILSGPTVAHGRSDDRASFAELLRDVVDDRLSFEPPQGGSNAAWQHAPTAPDNVFDLQERWQRFDPHQPDVDAWHEAFDRWNKRWQDPDEFRNWQAWGRDWQSAHSLPAVPEPSGLALLAAGLAALVAARRRAG